MKLKKNLLGTILGIASVASCLSGTLLLNDGLDVKAESQTSNLMYNFADASFELGGKNSTLKVQVGTFADMVDGDASSGLNVNFNPGNLSDGGNVSITVDLGAVYNLKHFYMTSIQRYADSYFTYELSVSTNGTDYTLVTDPVVEEESEYVTCTNVDKGTSTASMDISGAGRYFKLDYVGVRGTTNQWMINIYEMELYGYALEGYETDYAEKTVMLNEGETVETVLSKLSVAGNATVQYCNAEGEEVTDTARLAAEGDVIKIADNIETSTAGSYDAANVSYADEYVVVYKTENVDSEIVGNRNVYVSKNISDVIVPLDLGLDKSVDTIKVDGVVKNVSVEKGEESLTIVALTEHLKYGENVV